MSTDYYGLERADLLPLVPSFVTQMLDVGCGAGGFGNLVRRSHPHLVVDGVETASIPAERARTHYRRVFEGPFPDVMNGETGLYDLIAFNDVLEHMVDPWAALAASKQWLSAGGTVIVSVPNLANLSIIRRLVKGRFDYEDKGVLDRTHLRFFTVQTAREMVTEAGFQIGKEQLHWAVLGGKPAWILKRVGLEWMNYRQVGFCLSTAARS